MEVLAHTSGKYQKVFTIKQGLLTIQANENEAKSLCKSMADELGFVLMDKSRVNMLIQKANNKSTRKYPLGGGYA